jgi:hypothetical protein
MLALSHGMQPAASHSKALAVLLLRQSFALQQCSAAKQGHGMHRKGRHGSSSFQQARIHYIASDTS